MAKKKVTFGTMANCKVKYAIVKLDTDNTFRFATKVQTYPHKWVEWKDGEKAKLFEDKKYAEDICFGLNANGFGTFVMEIPDYFNDDDFQNIAKCDKEEVNEKDL